MSGFKKCEVLACIPCVECEVLACVHEGKINSSLRYYLQIDFSYYAAFFESSVTILFNNIFPTAGGGIEFDKSFFAPPFSKIPPGPPPPPRFVFTKYIAPREDYCEPLPHVRSATSVLAKKRAALIM